jgi:H+-translocating NAD(P) transhydrogenase subunit alpha
MLLAMLIFLIVCAVLGYIVISSVPSLLHTPLMSGMNALSGITAVGALYVYSISSPGLKIIAAAALILAIINVTGGFLITEKMLRMFKKENNK